MEQIGFSVKSTPEIIFESPDVHKQEEGEFWVGLVASKIQTPQQACEHLGLEYDEEYWTKAEEQLLQQQQDANKPQEGEPSESKPKQGVTYEVHVKPD